MSEIPEFYSLLISTIQQLGEALSDDAPMRVLTLTDILLKASGEEFVKKHDLEDLQDSIHNMLLNKTNFRVIRLNNLIKGEMELGCEYLDKNRGSDTRLYYNEELEDELMDIYKRVRDFLAILIREKLNENFEIG
jgi:hypothetical protein